MVATHTDSPAIRARLRAMPEPTRDQSEKEKQDARIFKTFVRTLTSWALFDATFRLDKPSFGEGGSISRRAIRVEASFCTPVVLFSDFHFARLRARANLGDYADGMFEAFWKDQSAYATLESRYRVGSDHVTATVWSFTEKVATYFTGLEDAPQRVREWKSARAGKPRDWQGV